MKLKPIIAIVVLLFAVTAQAGYYYHDKIGHLNTKHRIAALDAELEGLQSILNVNQTPYFAQTDWFKRITLSGLVKIYGLIGSRNPSFLAGRFPASKAGASDAWLARANLYIDADVNSWTTAHLGFRAVTAPVGTYASINDPAAYAPATGIFAGAGFGGAAVDEGYITVANFAKSPLYARAGREYVRFGRYHRDELPASLPQMLSQLQASTLELGFVDASGFNGAIYVFRGAPKLTQARTDINNGGGQVGYIFHQNGFEADVSLEYLYNMADVNYIAGTPVGGVAVGSAIGGAFGVGYASSVGGFSANVDVTYGLFDAVIHFVTAVDSFAPSEFAWKGRGAEPAALLVGVGYTFDTMGHPSRFGISFQESSEALTVGGIFGTLLGMPEERFQADYTLDMWRNTQLGFHIVYDQDYGVVDGGTGSEYTTGLVSIGAMFS